MAGVTGISGLWTAVYTELADILATAGYPPLTGGKIYLGRQHVFEASSPPRIVAVPRRSKFSGRDVYNASVVSGYPSAEVRLQNQVRSVATDSVLFEVHVWGCQWAGSPLAPSPDPDYDFDWTMLLYQQLIRSIHNLAEGSYALSDGDWPDQTPQGSQLDRLGHEYVFGVTFLTPVLDALLPFAPSAVTYAIDFASDDAGMPIEITTHVDHGLANGNTVTIAAVGGQTLANGIRVITVTGTNTFTIPIDGDGSHTYTTGGTVTAAEVAGTLAVQETDDSGTVINTVTIT